MGQNRVFFPQAALDQWVHENKIEFTDRQLTLRGQSRNYRIVEAVRVLAEVSGSDDLYDIVGKVKSVSFMSELGAELLGSSMIIGDSAYEVISGFMGTPIGSFSEHRRSMASLDLSNPSMLEGPKSEEDLLAQYLVKNME